MKKFEEYLYEEVSIVIDSLFEKLKLNNINVELEKTELNEKELENYLNIYNESKESLTKLKDKIIAEFGYIDNFDYIFASVIQDIVIKKQELWFT